jgi:hypothetical protein
VGDQGFPAVVKGRPDRRNREIAPQFRRDGRRERCPTRLPDAERRIIKLRPSRQILASWLVMIRVTVSLIMLRSMVRFHLTWVKFHVGLGLQAVIEWVPDPDRILRTGGGTEEGRQAQAELLIRRQRGAVKQRPGVRPLPSSSPRTPLQRASASQ